jgi:hypothetical protein
MPPLEDLVALEPDLTFEAQRIVPLNAYIQDIEVLMLQCQQKNVCGIGKSMSRGLISFPRGFLKRINSPLRRIDATKESE